MGSRVIKRITLFFLVIGLFILSGCQLNLNVSPKTEKNPNPQIMEVYDLLNAYYYKKLPLDISKIESVEELLTYVDRYTYIYATTRSIDMGNQYVGLGVTISEHDEGILITDINIRTDRDAHLYVGDIITAVNGTLLKGLSFDEKALLLKGEKDEEKTLDINRFDDKVSVVIPLIEVPFDSIEYQKKGNYGYIKILRFAGDTGTAFKAALTALEKETIEGLIIDVRDNGGGYLLSSVDVLNQFIDNTDPYLYIHEVKSNHLKGYKNDHPVTAKVYPVKVLVNEHSASASEIVAGTMQQVGFELIGEKTFGKDVYQTSHQLSTFPKDTYLSITGGYWLLKDKTRVNGGIKVDIERPQTGVLALEYPVVLKVFHKGDAHPIITTYQYLLSLSIESFYEPALFDDHLEAMILTYQQQNGLEPTKILDAPTQLSLIDFYRTLIKDNNNDHQLNYAFTTLGV